LEMWELHLSLKIHKSSVEIRAIQKMQLKIVQSYTLLEIAKLQLL